MPVVKKMILAALATLVAFVVYWRTLLPTVSLWGDSAKFQYIAQVWGIPHPTGYPLYILLTRLFALLPIGDVAYRVNLLSAVCGAAAVGCLVLAAAEVSRDTLAATAAALMLAFSPTFWSQAVVAEVYALNALFVVLCLAWLFRWREKGQFGALHAFLLVYGLSFSHHLSMILLLPAFLYLIARREPRVFLQPRTLVFGLLGVGLGLAPYTYILLRAAQGAVISEFPPLAGRPLLVAFVDYVSGAQFRSGFFAVFTNGPAMLLARVELYVNLLGEQFGWWGVGLGLLGLVLLWRRDRPLVVGLVLAFLGETIFPLGYDIIDPQVYFIPSYLIWALLISMTLGWLRSKIAGWPRTRLGLMNLEKIHW